jgi:hypothetical protein
VRGSTCRQPPRSRDTTLRQVTRDDVVAWLDGRNHQASDAHALRDLFGVLKVQRLIFANPARRVRASGKNPSTPHRAGQPDPVRHRRSRQARPSLQVVVALVGVHALHPHEVRRLMLDQIDLPNLRLDPNGNRRALASFTAAALTEYLDYRHNRWPDTGNPHLLLTRRTAHKRGPVSAYWFATLFRGLPATAAQLREDRILDEARTAAGDPLHIAAMFGLTAKPALRYTKTLWPEKTEPSRWFPGHHD